MPNYEVYKGNDLVNLIVIETDKVLQYELDNEVSLVLLPEPAVE